MERIGGCEQLLNGCIFGQTACNGDQQLTADIGV